MSKSIMSSYGALLDLKAHVLVVVKDFDRPCYGSEIRRTIGMQPGVGLWETREPSNSSLYPALRKLTNDGFLAADIKLPEAGEQGPPRRVYSLTKEGGRVAKKISSYLATPSVAPSETETPAGPLKFPVAAKAGGDLVFAPA